jgi:hypothetical protein
MVASSVPVCRWVAVLFAGGLAAGAVSAQGLPGSLGGGIGIASAQTQRGLSTSSGEPALFVDAYWRGSGGWQASLGAARWAAQPGRASGEYTATVSRSQRFDDDWFGAAALSHVGGIGGDPVRRTEYDEVALSLGWQGRLQVVAAASPNFTSTDRNGAVATRYTTTFELSWHEALPDRWALDAGIGHFSLRAFDRPGYWYASVGASRGFGPFLASVAYVTNHRVAATVAPEIRASRWLLSLWWSY